MPSSSNAIKQFNSTRWSLVFRAGCDRSEDSRAAMATLCECYWYPIYAFVRDRGYNPHDAADLTQGFFTSIIDQNNFNQLDPTRGRFRAFLLASLKNYLSDDWRRSQSLKRGGRMNGISLEIAELDQRYQRRLAEHCSPEVLFERRWVESLLAHVLQLLRQDYDKAGKPEFFALLSEYLVATGNRLPQAEIAKQLGISVSAVTMSLQRMRKRYATLLRQELGHTVLNPADIDDEIMRLKATMATTSCVEHTLSE